MLFTFRPYSNCCNLIKIYYDTVRSGYRIGNFISLSQPVYLTDNWVSVEKLDVHHYRLFACYSTTSFPGPFRGWLHDPITWYTINYGGTLGLPKQKNSYQPSPTFFCFESRTLQLVSRHNLFIPCDRNVQRAYWFFKFTSSRKYFFSKQCNNHVKLLFKTWGNKSYRGEFRGMDYVSSHPF